MSPPEKRVIGLSVQTGLVGFAVVEHPQTLFDWGTLTSKPESRDTIIERVRAIMVRTEATHLAIDDPQAWGYRKGRNSTKLIEAISAEAKILGVDVKLVSGVELREAIGAPPSANRYEIGLALSNRFIELARNRPKERKFYEREEDCIVMFMAVALGLTVE